MIAYLQSILDRALAVPGGVEYGGIIILFLLLPLVLILYRLISGDTGGYENPKPEGWTMPRREID